MTTTTIVIADGDGRIPRYELLLKDLIKHTWLEHGDYESLHTALTKIKEAAKLLNRAKSFNESRQHLLPLQQHLARAPSQNQHQHLHQHQSHPHSQQQQQRLSLPSVHGASSYMSLTRSDMALNPTLEQKYIGEGPLLYREVTGIPLEMSMSEMNLHDDGMDGMKAASNTMTASDQAFLSQPSLRSPTGNGPQITQHQVYVYLFTDVLLLTKKTKTSEGALNKVFSGLARNNSNKGSKYTHFANISLDQAFVDSCVSMITEKRKGTGCALRVAREELCR